MPYFDGHMHTTFSDGNFSPEELAKANAKVGTKVVALTDHDTLNGHERMGAACAANGVEWVPAVEMSVDLLGKEIHVLAYFVGTEHTAVKDALDASLAQRKAHLKGALAKLKTLGFELTEEEVVAQAMDQSVGRPHIAKAMMKRGYVNSVDEAFKRFLGDGKPGHLPRQHVPAEKMIALVNAAGGVCSSAHPGIYGLEEERLKMLKDMGLKGIECYHPEHDPSDLIFYLRQCEALALVPTGGSDFHAQPDKKHVKLGSHGLDQKGYERLQAARGK
ncbi:MAG: PHP domain-containing protein [Deltaproteobacteria bacterium]|nr:PHP domain-containing protein [Deltaproteobacteria bacterium]